MNGDADADLRALRLMILESIRDNLAGSEIAPEQIVEPAEFGVDLAVDSLDLQILAQDLEDTYRIELGPDDAKGLTTVGATIDYVVRAVRAAGLPR